MLTTCPLKGPVQRDLLNFNLLKAASMLEGSGGGGGLFNTTQDDNETLIDEGNSTATTIITTLLTTAANTTTATVPTTMTLRTTTERVTKANDLENWQFFKKRFLNNQFFKKGLKTEQFKNGLINVFFLTQGSEKWSVFFKYLENVHL